MNYKHVYRNVEEAMEELISILSACKNEDFDEGESLVAFQHALNHLFFAYNARFWKDKELESLTDEDWDELHRPPDIF